MLSQLLERGDSLCDQLLRLLWAHAVHLREKAQGILALALQDGKSSCCLEGLQLAEDRGTDGLHALELIGVRDVVRIGHDCLSGLTVRLGAPLLSLPLHDVREFLEKVYELLVEASLHGCTW